MVRPTAHASGRAEPLMPRIRHWWEDCTWTAFAASVEERAASASTGRKITTRVQRIPEQIPELATRPLSNPRHIGPFSSEREFEGQHTPFRQSLLDLGIRERDRLLEERDQLQMESADLSNKISTMRRERDQLQTELSDLHDQVPTLSRERDELLAIVAPLRTELVDLHLKDQELRQLESEIQALRHQKSSLDREILPQLRGSTEKTSPNKHRFHDS